MRYALLFVAACGGGGGPATVSQIDGTATVGGKPAKITGCSIEMLSDPTRPGLVVTLDTGHKYRNDPYAGPRVAKGSSEWEKTDCERISSNGSDGGISAWAKGKLGITCKHADGVIVIDATYDCGVVDRPTNRKD